MDEEWERARRAVSVQINSEPKGFLAIVTAHGDRKSLGPYRTKEDAQRAADDYVRRLPPLP